MGAYTVYNDQRVDDTVNHDLKLIVERVISALPVRSIILGGGFGRSEGSVLINEHGIHPVNDYDLFLIVPDDVETDMRPLGKKLSRELGIRLIDLIPLRHSDLNTLPASQIFYDLKYGGQVLWGENTLELIPQYKEGFVLPESGKTLLLNRLICALEAFSENFEKRAMTKPEIFFLVNQTGKVISACVEALLIKKSIYHHSYITRQKIFDRQFPDKVKLQQLNKRAMEFRLRPSETITFDPISYWKETMREYLDVIADYLVPFSVSPQKDLWRLLKNSSNISSVTNNPVERIEIMLLLCHESSFYTKRIILSQAWKELGIVTQTPVQNKDWEILRQRTTRLWHELYH